MGSISGTGIGSAAPTRAWAISAAAALAWFSLTGAVATGRLDVEFTQLRSDKGVLQICLTSDAADFPNCKRGVGAVRRTIAASAPRIRFDNLPPGTYAIAVIHDANSNAKLDTALGIPREGFGFSRNPAVGFGPPSFAAARFETLGGTERQQVRIRYLL